MQDEIILTIDTKGHLLIDGKEALFGGQTEADAGLRFTAVGRYREDYLVVGQTGEGQIFAYASVQGRDWIPVNLIGRKAEVRTIGNRGGDSESDADDSRVCGAGEPVGYAEPVTDGWVEPTEPVEVICNVPEFGMTFLLGQHGQIITLNGCPRCVKVSYFGTEAIVAGVWEKDHLRLTYGDGSVRCFFPDLE